MSVALRGNIRDFGIAEVFQLIGQQRKTGVLEFRGQQRKKGGLEFRGQQRKTGVLEFRREFRERIQLRFDRGLVVSASPVGDRTEAALAEMLVRCGRISRERLRGLEPESEASAQTVPRLAVSHGWIDAEELEGIEDLLTRETLFEVLQWESGEFDFRAQTVTHERRVDALLGAEQILMDSLRMVDEWQSFSEQVPSDEIVFQRTMGFEDYRRRSGLDPAHVALAERVFGLVDGRIPVRRIVDLSLLGSFDAVRILADLRRSGALEPLDPEALQQLRALPVASEAFTRDRLLTGLVSIAPLVLLGCLLWWVASASAPAQPGYALHSPAGEEVRDAYATRRVRHAIEAYRFATGGWPASLDGLAREDLLPKDALAGPAVDSYYYARRDGGALVLAPAR
ncbi:MAG: DUF4388 domain-containing protein [Myxococcota bacterium]|nr:DUF4388 domain-containing protein [Myxococcota bacterium]